MTILSVAAVLGQTALHGRGFFVEELEIGKV
jgi:hypothetical protein